MKSTTSIVISLADSVTNTNASDLLENREDFLVTDNEQVLILSKC